MGSDAADPGDQPKRNSGQRFACLGYSKEINEPSDEKQFAAVSHSATPALKQVALIIKHLEATVIAGLGDQSKA